MDSIHPVLSRLKYTVKRRKLDCGLELLSMASNLEYGMQLNSNAV